MGASTLPLHQSASRAQKCSHTIHTIHFKTGKE
uniref:Uncharacterized protein n=1 Tax=Anguilla anguilla TaxID=7936 RepID=A0A0E9P5F3_ANGAN